MGFTLDTVPNVSKAVHLKLAMRMAAENSLYYLMTEILGYEDFYEPLHRPMCEHFQAEFNRRYRLTLIPRGHFKTTIGNVGQSIHKWLLNPMHRILHAHYRADQAWKNLSEIKHHFVNSDKLKFIADDICYKDPEKDSPVWLKDQITLKRPKFHRVPSYVATGIDGSNVGLHFNQHIFDDLVTEQNIGTPDQLEKPYIFIQSARAMFINQAQAITDVIGTRWAHGDTYEKMADPKGPYRNSCTKLVMSCYDDQGEPRFPTRYPKDVLQELKESMGSWAFSAQYLNNPVPEDAKMFSVDKVHLFNELPPDENGRPIPLYTFTAVDPNRREEERHDPGVVLTMGRDAQANFYELGIDYRRFSVSEMVGTIFDHVDKFGVQLVIVETVAGQYYLLEALRQEMVRRGKVFSLKESTRGPTVHKTQRMLRIQPVVERGKVWLREGDNALLDELKDYPFSKADHALDAFSDIILDGYDPNVKMAAPNIVGQFALKRLCLDIERDRDQSPWGGIQLSGKKW